MGGRDYLVGVLANKKDLEDRDKPYFTEIDFKKLYGNEKIEMYQ